ncbi:hypothetical protein BDN70DRAFT_946594 [Pholiota conissans]|uniref:Uncharacterized protein n=1 Tax=Pholiota conissans TaxID=109636 RepID=A0A9P5YXR2_9AGAR|nr:hypothetical protein BDN70DRAFT_946594 [Pholiota conissans]
MPHKVTTLRRYKISNDVLMLILEKLTPVALYKTCQAFQRVWMLVMEFQHLRYKFELAVVGMKDGPASYSMRSPLLRLQLLTAYKKDWPRLMWNDELKVRVPPDSTQLNLASHFLYYTGNQSLDLVELPSCRTSRPPSQTHHLKYITSHVDCVAVDPLQSLIVTSSLIGATNGQIVLRLKIRDLWTFDKHAKAPSANYECSTHIAQPISNVYIAIAGTRMVVTLDFVGGLTRHLLMDWRTFQAMWLEEQDVVLLNSHYLLGVRKVGSHSALYLYNVSDMRTVAIEREYELPPIWAKSALRFGRNNAPTSDITTPSTALFYADPAARVLLLTAKQTGPNANGMHWMFITEAFFRPTSHPDRRIVPWIYWSQFCLIRELQINQVVGQPQVVGSRVVYLEKNGTRSSRGHERSHLSVIDLSPYAEIATLPPAKLWTLIGKQSTLRPSETHRDIPSATTNGLAVENLYATEDNIVLVFETHGDYKPVNILTFGVPSTYPARIHDAYHPAH